MYEWLIFAHVAAVLGFMLAHGVHVAVMWKMRQEADPQLSMTLFNVLPHLTLLRVLLGLVVLTGVVAGFVGSWWGRGWMWLSLAILTVIAVAMYRYAGPYYGLIERGATTLIEASDDPTGQAEARRAFDAARGSWHPIGMMVIGLGGTAVILWLMMFKPF